MKFGQQMLESMPPDWKFYFVDYQGLKQFIKMNTQVKGPWNNNHETTFIGMLEDEVKKVSSFEMVKRTELERHVQFLENEFNAMGSNVAENENASDVRAEMDAVTKDLTKLAKFNSLNYTACLKIIKKHDKYTGFRLKETFMAQINHASFFKEAYDDLVVKLSAQYERFLPHDEWRETRVPIEGHEFDKWSFWVHPDNLTEVQCIILKHLPVYRTPLNELDNKAQNREDPSDENKAVSSVYLDTDRLDVYNERLAREVSTQTIRLRWFGPSHKHVYVERQLHNECWTSDKSSRERFSIPEKYLGAYLKGEYSMASRVEKLKKQGLKQPEIDRILKLAQEIQDTIAIRSLNPVVRTFSHRTIFKIPNVETISITLDKEIAMIREADRTNGNWVRLNVGVDYPFPTLPEHEVHLFPYAELEVKLADTPPEWVVRLCNSHLVERVPKFSKFLHGCATVLEDRVDTTPYWMSNMTRDIRKPPKEGEGSLLEDRSEVSSHSTAHSGGDGLDEVDNVYAEERRVSLSFSLPKHVVGPKGVETAGDARATTSMDTTEDRDIGALRMRKAKNVKLLSRLLKKLPAQLPTSAVTAARPAPRVAKKPIAIPVRVEPKVFYANERTFLHWTKVSVVISTLGLALIHAPPSSGHAARMAGYIMVPIAMGLCVYALYTFFWRDYKINHRDPGPYSAPAGPVLVTVTFTFSLMLNYFMWLNDHGYFRAS